ncbi:MAG TPA: heme exporter protein CcmD [Hyphomonadaceae bacterium]|jgi:heme exporter protein CcmD|nr:heme exporter protein CcmD [Hyphomonadaceae bacterium]
MLPELVKYAPYIYSAYGIAIAVLVGMVIWSVLRIRHAKKKLDALEAAEAPPKAGSQ